MTDTLGVTTLKDQIELREKWADALESGAYPQACYALRKGQAFCCLGVLCDIYDSEGWNGAIGSEGMREYKGVEGVLPTEVRQAVGLREADGTFLLEDDNDPTLTTSLAQINDDGGSFAEIAKIIRDGAPGLFEEWEG